MAEIDERTKQGKRFRHAGEYVITGVEIFPQGTVRVVRMSEAGGGAVGGKRTEVEEFSRASRERLAIVSRETIHTFSSLMTLTYGKHFPANGRRVKKDLNRFLVWYRRYVGGEYIWWLEFQKRGAPHIHVASQRREIHWYDREEFADRWARAQGLQYGLYYSDLATKRERNMYDDVVAVHSHRKQWQQARKEDGPKRYILKYALKMRQKIVPKAYQNVGRFWGCSRGVALSIPEPKKIRLYEVELREILEACDHMSKDWEHIPKNLWGIAHKFDKP